MPVAMEQINTFKPLTDPSFFFQHPPLKPIQPKFFVPRLENKPQNPIIESLALYQHVRPRISTRGAVAVASESAPIIEESPEDTDLWVHAGSEPRKEGSILSWDTLRTTRKFSSATSSFLTEQPPHIFAAARFHALPRLRDPQETPIHMEACSLIDNLRETIVGCSSPLHMWDGKTERFVPPGTDKGKRTIVLNAMDDVVSESFIGRFVLVGTLLRRLETLVASLRVRFSNTQATLHSFTHALSSVLVHIRNELYELGQGVTAGSTLSTFWLSFSEPLDGLTALAALCQRDIDRSPEAYGIVPQSASELLSLIWDSLVTHFEQHSSRNVRSLLAYIFTVSSRPYFQHLAELVGRGGAYNSRNTLLPSRRRQYGVSPATANEDDDESEHDDADVEEMLDVPSFLPQDVADIFVRAQKSLKILEAARHHAPAAADGIIPLSCKLGWIWTELDILLAHGEHKSDTDTCKNDPPNGSGDASDPPAQEKQHYRPELSRFQLFDMEPGLHMRSAPLESTRQTQPDSLVDFLDSFPDALPSITPTLPHLTMVVLSPLLEQARALSRAALLIFLTRSSSLHLRTHLLLLRSYLLLTAHAFKSRLSGALFSDADVYASGADGVGARASSKLRVRGVSGAPAEAAGTWAVGLGYGLTERETWPPGGSDLSFYLRTVIVDSLEEVRIAEESRNFHDFGNGELGSSELWEEAESRIGFAIRDLPVGTGREKWLDPTSIEALDFLYLDYKPPQPLQCLITPDILSKYQRVFAFLLRLLRVENVMRLLLRFNRSIDRPVFETLTGSNKLLLHFRFIGQSFVASLSAHTYNTAIGGNYDTFLASLEAAEKSPDPTALPMLSDVFALADYHSRVMDDILSACLLRSGQRAVGDLLRGCLEILLELGVLIGELKRRRIEEHEAAPQLESLYGKFQEQMTILVKVLRTLLDKGTAVSHGRSGAGNLNADSGSDKGLPRATGGTESLHHLLLRLDLSEWWKRAAEGR